MPTRRSGRPRRGLRAVAIGVAVVCVLGLAGIGGVVWWSAANKVPLPLSDRCVATVDGRSTTLSPDQAYYAALIAGVSVRRGLVPRAASIALATAYQESGIRNLDYGHADSLGLFQQRPSQGWGTEAEIMDPWYSANQFYKALVKVDGWQDGDINDVAQDVQRSGFPEAYRKHVANARTLASALTGETAAAFSCTVRTPAAPDPAGMADYLRKTFGRTVEVTTDGATVTVEAQDADIAWSVAQVAIAGTARYGLTRSTLGKWTWSHDTWALAGWHGPGSPSGPTRVTLDFDAG